MRLSWKIGLASLIFGYFTACSPVQFEKAAEAPCGSAGVACEQKCTGDQCIRSYMLERMAGEGLVDILIINDNSGSMSLQQSKMADRFPTFLASLGTMNYRIAMTTTDISSTYSQTPIGVTNSRGPYNGEGALQDGNLIVFGNGQKYIESTTPGKEALFNKEIVRQETLDCEASNFTKCPSDDERGIFAANLVLDRTSQEFMRPTAPTHVIILANEDERGLSDPRSVHNDNDRALLSMYPLEKYDLAETFIDKFQKKYPGKPLAVHSFIIKPGDGACLQAQTDTARNIRGKEGYSYEKLTAMTGGVLGSICDTDYGAKLAAIANQMQDVPPLPFDCRPINDDFDVEFEPQPSFDVDVTADFNKMQLQINDRLPQRTKVRLKYDCKVQ